MNDINCIIVDDEPIAIEVLENHLERISFINVKARCKNALEAFNIISTSKIDLVFLDISMPEISGLAFARSLNKEIKIIFTTAYREYAIDGFDLQAVDYLLKPISFDRLIQAINKFSSEHLSRIKDDVGDDVGVEKNDHFFVRADRKMVKISFHDIFYLESLSDYVRIHCGKGIITTRETITNVEARLPKNEFIRVHRSFIVALTKIDSYNNEVIEIAQKEIPISRGYRKSVLERLGQY